MDFIIDRIGIEITQLAIGFAFLLLFVMIAGATKLLELLRGHGVKPPAQGVFLAFAVWFGLTAIGLVIEGFPLWAIGWGILGVALVVIVLVSDKRDIPKAAIYCLLSLAIAFPAGLLAYAVLGGGGFIVFAIVAPIPLLVSKARSTP